MDRLTDHDLRNLRFLLSLGKIGLMRFMQQASKDDIEYANELMIRYRIQLEEDALAGSRQSLHDLVFIDDEIEDFTEANEVLSKFMLSNNK